LISEQGGDRTPLAAFLFLGSFVSLNHHSRDLETGDVCVPPERYVSVDIGIDVLYVIILFEFIDKNIHFFLVSPLRR
jgi:hypothetical protein